MSSKRGVCVLPWEEALEGAKQLRRRLVVRIPSIGGAENGLCFSHSPGWALIPDIPVLANHNQRAKKRNQSHFGKSSWTWKRVDQSAPNSGFSTL